MPEERVQPKSNDDHEFLIDVHLGRDGKTFFIYDITAYFPSYRGISRKNYLARVLHVIAGKKKTVYVIGDEGDLSNDHAKQIAIKFVEGSLTNYRLD